MTISKNILNKNLNETGELGRDTCRSMIKDFFLGQLMISSEISRNILESRLNSFKEIFVSGSRTFLLFSLK